MFFDFAGALLAVGIVLLIVGTLPFTPLWVGILLVLAKSELRVTF